MQTTRIHPTALHSPATVAALQAETGQQVVIEQGRATLRPWATRTEDATTEARVMRVMHELISKTKAAEQVARKPGSVNTCAALGMLESAIVCAVAQLTGYSIAAIEQEIHQ